MANIISTTRQDGDIEANQAKWIFVDALPTAAGGTAAAVGTFASVTDGSGCWFKDDVNDGDWTQLATV